MRGSSRRRFGLRAVPLGLAALMMIGGMIGTASAQSRKAHGGVSVARLPAAVRSQYKDYHQYARLYSNPYTHWKIPKAPWKFCESTNYLGNSWEEGNRAELAKLVGEYHKAGLAKAGLTTVNSNTSVPLQISQMTSLINEGCNVIFSIPGSATALCPVISKALRHGILVVTDDTPVYCKDVINSSFSEFESAYVAAHGLFKALHYRGNVIMETGIPGAVGAQTTENGFKAALKGHPGIHVLGYIAGDWTDSVAQTQTAQFLSTHPQTINGIYDGSGMSTGGELALKQAGRPLAKENMYEDECSTMALWKEHPNLIAGAQDQGPQLAAYETFLVTARMLAGEKPIVNTLLYPIPGPTKATFHKWYKRSMTVQSTCYAIPPKKAITSNSYYKGLFKGGAPLKVKLSL